MNNAGGSFLGLLTILFIGLKLTGYINWSWWLVLLPFWGGLLLVLLVFVVSLFILAATQR